MRQGGGRKGKERRGDEREITGAKCTFPDFKGKIPPEPEVVHGVNTRLNHVYVSLLLDVVPPLPPLSGPLIAGVKTRRRAERSKKDRGTNQFPPSLDNRMACVANPCPRQGYRI